MREPLLDRDDFDSHYEDRVAAPVRHRGALPAAGVYLAPGGRWEVAAHGGAAERALCELGALLVATVTFDGAPIPSLTGGGMGGPRAGGLLPYGR
jgi:hypothetical protein